MKIGIDIGGSHIGVAIFDDNNLLLDKQERYIHFYRLDNNQGTIEKNIVELIQNLLNKNNLFIQQIEKIGIACPGIVNDTHIVKAKNLKLSNYPIVNNLKKYFSVPIKIQNDAICAAIAEKTYGKLKNCQDAIFLTIGTGIGGAVFMNGKMLKPLNSYGLKLGHMIIQINGKQCSCGKLGCFEAYASMKNFKNKVREKLKQNQLSGKEIRVLFDNKTYAQELSEILEEYIYYLGIGISNLITIFEPEKIVLGGSISYYETIILDKLKLKISEIYNNSNKINISNIEVATLKNQAGMIGAIL